MTPHSEKLWALPNRGVSKEWRSFEMFPHLLEVLDAEFDDHDFVYAAVRRHALRSPNDLFARLTGRLIKVAEIFRGRWIGFVQHGTKKRNNIWVLLVRRFVSLKLLIIFVSYFVTFTCPYLYSWADQLFIKGAIPDLFFIFFVFSIPPVEKT